MKFDSIRYLHEPTPLQCGQAVLAMLTGRTVAEVIQITGTQRETTLKDMLKTLAYCGIACQRERKQVTDRQELPPVCVLSLETPKCWHWSLWCKGLFYDPEYGILEDFPPSSRRYYWEISEE